MILHDCVGGSWDTSRKPQRVVSLVPSLTETLVALGAGGDLVGVTSYCVHPPGLAERMAAVGGTKTPRLEIIRSLEPDLVHMNLEENLRPHAEQIAEFSTVFVTDPSSVKDVDLLFATLGAIHGAGDAAARLREELASELGTISAERRNFTFATPIWKRPWMWCGGDTYVSALVEMAGGRNVFADQARYPEMTLEDVMQRGPEVIFLPDEPWRFTDEDRAAFISAGVRVIGPFDGSLFTWHGVRTIEGLRFLRSALS